MTGRGGEVGTGGNDSNEAREAKVINQAALRCREVIRKRTGRHFLGGCTESFRPYKVCYRVRGCRRLS